MAIALGCIAIVIKLRREDEPLARTFGAEFDTYRARVKALIPWVW